MRKSILISIIVVITTVLVALTWLVNTQSGLTTSLNIVKKFVPEINIIKAKGTLFNKFTLSDIRYKPEQGTTVVIDKLEFQWQPSALLKRHLYIQQLVVDGVNLTPGEQHQDTEESDSEFTLPDINLPLSVEVDKVSVNNVSVTNAESTNTLLKEVQLKIETLANELVIETLYVSRDDGQFQLNGHIGLTDEHTIALNYKAKLLNVLPEALELDGQINGTQQQLVLTQQVQQPFTSEQTLIVNDLTSSLSWVLTTSAEEIDVSKLVPEQALQLSNVNLQAEGTLTKVNSSLQVTAKQPDLPAINLDIKAVSEDMEEWSIQAEGKPDDKKLLTLSGKVNTSTPDITFDLKAIWQQLQWPLVGHDALIKSEQGEVKLTGSLKDYQATLNTVMSYQDMPVTMMANLKGNESSILISQLNLKGFGGEAETEGYVDWSSTPLTYDITAHWQDLTIPASLTELNIDIKRGQLSLVGDTNAMTLRSETNLTVNKVAMSMNATGEGRTDIGFEQSQLHIQLGQGQLEYQGRLAWAGQSLVDGELKVNQFNPGIILPDWPAELSGLAPIKVSQDDNALEIELNTLKLSGSLRQKPIAIEAKLKTKAEDVWIERLTASSADSNLALSGQVQKDIVNIDWTLSSPDLRDIYPGLNGRFNGSGKLTGAVDQPRIQAEIDGHALAYETIKVDAVSGNIDFSLQQQSNINSHINVAGLAVADQRIKQVDLQVKGQEESHQIQLSVVSELMDLDMVAQGHLEQSIWTGNFTQFNFGNQRAGIWNLTEKGELKLSAKQQDIPRHCWQSDKGNLCIAASHQQTQWQTSGDFSELPLTLFEPFVKELEQVKGQLKGQFNVTANSQNHISGSGKIQLENGSIQLEQADIQQKQPLILNNTYIEYQLDETETKAQLHIEPKIDGVSAINAQLETSPIEALMADTTTAKLKGKVTTHIADMSALQLSHPAIEGLKGKLDVNIDIHGTLAQPEIDGKAQLANGQVSVIDAGIILKNIQADINGNMDQVDMTLTADSGEGRLNVTGKYALQQTGWEFTAKVSGKQLEVMNTPEALVIAEPDMTIRITPDLTQVTGKVTIPKALIEPTRFNSSVSPSSDVIVISDNTTEETKPSQTQVDLLVILGDKVQIKAMGFQGRLTGDLHVSGNTDDVLIGNGQINIKDGSYIAYGQLLKVDNGKIRFSGPIDNPELDIKAIRTTKDVTAGLYIEGNVSSPQATLFSDPDMSQDNILSYLILGKPIEQAGATDAALLASAATGIGLQNGAMIGDDIANTFGLDEFSITGDSKENAALTIGKYLSPKLYLSYGIGVFDSVSSVELRYQLSKIWSLKAESGTESGVDLLYTYEPKKD